MTQGLMPARGEADSDSDRGAAPAPPASDFEATPAHSGPEFPAEGADRPEAVHPEKEKRSRVGGWPLAAVLAVVAVVAYIVRYALLPFCFAIAIAFIAEPVVQWLARRTGWRRWIAAAVLSLLIVLVIAGTVYWLGTMAVADISEFAKTAPQTATKFVAAIVGPRVDLFGQTYTPAQLVQKLGGIIAAFLGTSTAMKALEMGMGTVFGGFLTLVLIPYFMVSAPRLSQGAVWLIPPERRHSVLNLLPKIIPALRRYLAGVLAIVIYTTVVAYIGFGLVFHVPHAVVLSVAVGILEMIPAAGPFLSGVLVAITAFQEKGLTTIIFLGVFAIALRLSIDNVVAPILLGKAGRIHPAIVIFSFVIGAMLFGILGLILAVPVAVCLRIALQHYYNEPIANGDEVDRRDNGAT
ncbi:MAG TPA: AI-2E family transporter [Stellaceae bacterium]|nr:AI-2E family transporter [Stellaceae bacterium]